MILETTIFGTTMTVGEALISLGISLAANRISALTLNEQEELRIAYDRALEKWCKKDKSRHMKRYSLKDVKTLTGDILRGSLQEAPDDLKELLELWFDEMMKSEPCKQYLRKTAFHVLVDGIENVGKVAVANGEKIERLKDEILKSKDEVIEAITQAIKKEPHIIGITKFAPIDWYLPRYCHQIEDDETDVFWPFLQRERTTLYDCLCDDETANNGAHFMLYSSAQTGKTTELRKLAYDLQEEGYFQPVMVEVKYHKDLKMEMLPDVDVLDGKPIALLIDAIDESPAYEDVKAQIEGYAKQHPNMLIVATCRTNYRTIARLEVFTDLLLEDMTGSDVENYIRQHAQNPDRLIEEIKTQHLENFLTTPFIVIQTTSIFNKKGHLPKNRNELYKAFAELAYQNACKKTGQKISNSQARVDEFHRKFAMAMLITGNQLFTIDEIRQVAGGDDNLLEEVQRVNLVEKQGEGFGFIHNAFKEYYAADYLNGAGLTKVQSFACYKDSQIIKPAWNDVLMLWLIGEAERNGGQLTGEVLAWMGAEGRRLLIYSDHHFVEEASRFSLFKAIIEDCKQRQMPVGSILSEDFKHLMRFGYCDDTVKYITGEICAVKEPCIHLTNLMALMPYVDWDALKYNKDLYQALVTALNEKLPLIGDEERNCDVAAFLYHPHFVKQVDAYYPMLQAYENPTAISALLYMIKISGKADDYVSYLMVKDEKYKTKDGHSADRSLLYRTMQTVKSEKAVTSILRRISLPEYTMKNALDDGFVAMEQELLAKCRTFAEQGSATIAKDLQQIFTWRKETIYPYAVTEDQQRLMEMYRDILNSMNAMTPEIKDELERRLYNPSVTEEQRRQYQKQRQRDFDEMCQYELFRPKVERAIERLKENGDVVLSCMGEDEYVHRFFMYHTFHDKADVQRLTLYIGDKGIYERFRMCVVNEKMSDRHRMVTVSDEQVKLCVETAKTFLERMLQHDYNFRRDYLHAVLDLLIKGCIRLKDEELLEMFRFGHYGISTPQDEWYDKQEKATIFELVRNQLGEQRFRDFVLETMRNENLTISEPLYMLCADYMTGREDAEGCCLVMERMMKDKNDSLSSLLLSKLSKVNGYLDKLKNVYGSIPYESCRLDLLKILVDEGSLRKWALDQLAKEFSGYEGWHHKTALALLCDKGRIEGLDYLIQHPEECDVVGIGSLNYAFEEALDGLLALFGKVTEPMDRFGTFRRSLLANIGEIASKKEELLKKVVYSMEQMIRLDETGFQYLHQFIENCKMRYRMNAEQVISVNEAIKMI